MKIDWGLKNELFTHQIICHKLPLWCLSLYPYLDDGWGVYFDYIGFNYGQLYGVVKKMEFHAYLGQFNSGF